MTKKKIFILGAGLAGLSAAWHLQKRGFNCRVIEKEKEAGGLCRSKKISGFTFDYDGHLLHFKHAYAFNLIKELLGSNLCGHKRSAWVYSYGTYSRYPFQANLHGLPSAIAKECLLGFIKAAEAASGREVKKELSFLDWIGRTFGSGIARHFMVPYNTKFWTVPLKHMTCEWLDSFIPVPSLSQLVEGTLRESQKQFGYNAFFWYPRKGGISEVPASLASRIKNIDTGAKVTEIDLAKKEIRINSGTREKFDWLVSTVPLPEIAHLVKALPDGIAASFAKLKWNSIFNLNLGIDRKDSLSRHWAYFPQKEICFFRVGFPHNFSDSLVPAGKSSLYAEAAYSKDRPIDKNKIASRIEDALKKTGIVGQDDAFCVQDINDIKYGYPIYDINYRRVRNEIIEYLIDRNIMPCGRYGSWRYMSMEDALLDGRKVADRLAMV